MMETQVDTTGKKRCGPFKELWIGVFLTLIGLAIFVALDAWFAAREHEYQIKAGPSDELKAFLEEEDKRLNTIHYTTDRKDVVSIPIDQALDQYLQAHETQGSQQKLPAKPDAPKS